MKLGLSTKIALILFPPILTAAGGVALLALPSSSLVHIIGLLLILTSLGLLGWLHVQFVRPLEQVVQAMKDFGLSGAMPLNQEELMTMGPLGNALSLLLSQFKQREEQLSAHKPTDDEIANQAKMAQLQFQLTALESEISSRTRNLDMREAALEERRVTLERLGRDIEERQTRLDIQTHSQSEQCTLLEQRLRELETQQNNISNLTEALELHKLTARQQEQVLNERFQALASQTQILDEQRSTMIRRTEELNALQEQLLARASILTEQESNLELHSRTLEEREVQHAAALQWLETQRADHERLTSEISSQQQHLVAEQQAMETSLAAMERREVELERLQIVLTEERMVLATDQVANRQRALELDERQSALETMRQELSERSTAILAREEELEKSRALLYTHVQDLEKKSLLLESRSEELHITRDALSNALAEAERRPLMLAEELRQLEADRIAFNNQLEAWAKEQGQVYLRLQSLEEENQAVHQQSDQLLRTLESTNSKAQEQISTLFAELSQRDEHISRISQELEELHKSKIAAEKRLVSKQELIKKLTDSMTEGAYILDEDGRALYINAESERLLGWKQVELVGRKMHDVIHFQNLSGKQVPLEECPVHLYMQRGEICRVEKDVFTHRDGHLIPVSFISTPLYEDGVFVGSVTVFQDGAARQRIEDEIKQARDIALEASRLKSEFLANMSHEIRTPMNGIIGMAGLLMETKINKEQREYTATIRDSSQALLTIIDDILDFSKIEAGKLGILSVDFSPVKVVEDVAELMSSPAHRKSLTLLTDIASTVPPMLRGDPGRLRQVLINLSSNAVKFTKKGDVVLSVKKLEDSNGHVTLRFAVSDTGIGIPKNSLHRLFQPFVQVDGSTTREFGGTGLGLSISQRLVELMGGEMGVDSKKGKGSTFWFTVPLGRSSAPQDESPLPETATRLKGYKVLVADRNQTSQTILLNHLLNWNIKGTAVESPVEALTLLQHEASTGNPYHLVIVDCSYPAEESFELGRQVSNDPSLVATGLILLTTINDKSHFEAAQQAGFSAHLVKPLRRTQLLECMTSVLLPEQKEEERLIAAEQALPLAKSSLPDSDTAEQQGRLILLAEDNAVNQKVLQMYLTRLGFAVQFVANGREAVHAVRSHRCGVVLMDLQMPIMNGIQATRIIRKVENETNSSRIPIIALTAKFMSGEREQCLEAGMDDYLSKPVQIDELNEKLSRWLPLPSNGNSEGSDDDEEPTGRKELPPIEMARLEGYFGNDRKTVRDFLLGYLSFVEAFMNTLKKRLKQKEESLARAANELAEACSNAGATSMALLCRQLEEAATAKDWEKSRTLMDKMQRQYQRIEEFIKNY